MLYPGSGVCRWLKPPTLKALPVPSSEDPSGSGIPGQDAAFPRLSLGQAPQHRQHEVILPIGISCHLSTDWRPSPPSTHPWAPRLPKYLRHSLPGSVRPRPPGFIPTADVGQVSPSMAESEAVWVSVCGGRCSLPQTRQLS